MTGGFTATEKVFLYALDNAGTVELAVSSFGELDEEDLHTTIAIDATSDNRRTLYSTVARASVPIRLIGTFVSSQRIALNQ